MDPVTTAALIGAGSTVVGGLMGRSAAKKQAEAMQQQAAAQIEAAKIAAEEARFRPVGITTRFGSAAPQFDTRGFLTGYNYTPSGELTNLQQQLARIYQPSLGQAERAAALQPMFEQAGTGLFKLGQQMLPQTQEQLVAEQMNLLRPYDIEEEQRLAAGVFGRGRGGLSVGAGGQPELRALAEARARRNAQIAASAPELLTSRATQAAGLMGQGAGLFGTGYQTQAAALSPFQAQFGASQQLEDVAMQPMQIGAALGAKSSTFGSQAAAIQQAGANAAANLQSSAAQARAAGLAGMGAGIANIGQQYYNNAYLNNLLNPTTPAAPTSTPVTPSAGTPFVSQGFGSQGVGTYQPPIAGGVVAYNSSGQRVQGLA